MHFKNNVLHTPPACSLYTLQADVPVAHAIMPTFLSTHRCQVLSGMDVVTAVEEGATGPGDRPLESTLIAACGLVGDGSGSVGGQRGIEGGDWEGRVYG